MKILIVDDEPGVASRLAGEVDAGGWGPAYAATNGEDAVEIVNREGRIDLLVANVFMDGLDGFTLHETLRPHLPDLRVIFLSAYDLSEHADRVGIWPVLAKPLTDGDLTAELHRQLAPSTEPASPEPEPGEPPVEIDPLPGATLGSYRLDAWAGEDLDGRFYAAVQTSIGRAVEFHTLAPERAADPAEVERFLANARAKANAHHPALLSVFEAGESDGWYFYTSEARQGSSLWELASRRQPLDVPTLFQLLHTVAEVMVHFGQVKMPHEPLHAVHVVVDHRHRTRLVNIATQEAGERSARADMRTLAAAIAPLVPAHPSAAGLQQLLADMEAEAMTVRSWPALIFEVKRYSAGGAPIKHIVDAGDRAEIAAVGALRKRHRRRRALLAVLLGLLLLAAAGAAWFFLGGEIPFLKK